MRDSLASLARVQGFLHTSTQVQQDKEVREQGKSIGRDIQSLTEHASFVSGVFHVFKVVKKLQKRRAERGRLTESIITDKFYPRY